MLYSTIKSDASGIIIYHNHPSINFKLNESDINILRRRFKMQLFWLISGFLTI
ncbi:MAG: JAB domain-containing protein [Bacteroidales bacterium]